MNYVKINKRTGFTLIEVIVSIALLAISLSGASLLLSSASDRWIKDNTNLTMVAYNQSITQNLSNEGKNVIESIFNDSILKEMNEDSSCQYTIYFDNYDELKSVIVDIAHLNYIDKVDASQEYNVCLSYNSNNKRYGALVQITDLKDDIMSTSSDTSYTAYSYSLYKITSYAWDFKNGSNTKSISTIEIGR